MLNYQLTEKHRLLLKEHEEEIKMFAEKLKQVSQYAVPTKLHVRYLFGSLLR